MRCRFSHHQLQHTKTIRRQSLRAQLLQPGRLQSRRRWLESSRLYQSTFRRLRSHQNTISKTLLLIDSNLSEHQTNSTLSADHFYNQNKPNFSDQSELPSRLESFSLVAKFQANPKGVFVHVTVIASFHPTFVTKVDRAVRAQCFYMEADKTVSAELEASIVCC